MSRRKTKTTISYIKKLGVPEDKLYEYRESFDLFDKDKNGTISVNEIYSIMKNYGNPISKKEVQKMIDDVDTNGDGELNFEEFVTFMEKQIKTTVIEESNFAAVKPKIKELLDEILEKFFKDKPEYFDKKAQGWCKDLCQEIAQKMSTTFKDFKFVIPVIILARETGVHHESSAFWNSNTDGIVEGFYENDEIYCYVNVFVIHQEDPNTYL